MEGGAILTELSGARSVLPEGRETFGGAKGDLYSFLTNLWHNPFCTQERMVRESWLRDNLIQLDVIQINEGFLYCPRMGRLEKKLPLVVHSYAQYVRFLLDKMFSLKILFITTVHDRRNSSG